ncbi:MAG: sulfurtransferase TusA family protein [Spirochaetes bacterium]|nr:sulfurtransferase TusA family protein [Spirochaetota bacterium]
MNDTTTVDARGLSCPQPALLVRQALQKLGKGSLEVLVDSGTARENVSRLAKKAGWTVTLEEQSEGNFKITLDK